MVRHPVPISWMDEIISYYESNKPGHKVWFKRKMNRLSPDEQQQVWQRLEALGHHTGHAETNGHHKPPEEPEAEEQPQQRAKKIVWTDEEWDRLADLVWRVRKNEPTESLVGICKRVMPQFPAERRRIIRVNNDILPLIARLTERDEETLKTADELEKTKHKVEQLQAQIARIPTREEVLGTLTDEEVIQHYGQRLLEILTPEDLLSSLPHEAILSYFPTNELAAHLVRSALETYQDTQRELLGAMRELTTVVKEQQQHKPAPHRPSMPLPKPQVRLPRVTVVGLLPIQQGTVETKLKGRANFNFVDKNRKPDNSAIPDNQDVILLAANFINHSMQDLAKRKAQGTQTKVILHHGGIDTLIRRLDGLLPQPVLV